MLIYCVSDIHSFYTPLKKALDEKGFKENSEDHLLVVLGDVFDRGGESQQVYEFLNNLTNVVLIRGNHEDLMEAIWERGYCKSHDVSNGTLRTIEDLCCAETNGELHDAIKLSEQKLRPFFDKMVNYFETENYIFVHSFIALECLDDLPKYYIKIKRVYY